MNVIIQISDLIYLHIANISNTVPVSVVKPKNNLKNYADKFYIYLCF